MAARAQELAARLVSMDASVEEKQQYVSSFRDNVEELMTGASVYQDCIIDSFTHVLESIPPQPVASAEHKLRKSVLEVINRIPHTEVLKQHVSKLSRALLSVATKDNQENAIVAIQVVLDLLRAFKPTPEEVATPLLYLFTQFYDQWEATYRYYFVDMNWWREMTEEGPSSDNREVTIPLNAMDMQPSRRSFRVIAECPIAVLHLVQLYGNDIRGHVPSLITLMVKALAFEGTPDVAPYMQQAYKDMKFAQVKTVAFLSHYVKQSFQLMQPHEKEICDGLMNLLKTCPDVVQWRRELIISTRALLVTEFRKTLDERLDSFRDETAIVGSSRSCYEALRHYGYAVFAELAHQTRRNLKLDQLSWIVHRSCCIVSDTERPAGSHSTAVRLLLHLVEVIHQQRLGPDGSFEETSRELLQKILLCFAAKLSSMKHTKRLNSEVQTLLHNLFLGLKPVLYSLTLFNRPSSSQLPSVTSPACLTEQEIRLTVKIVKSSVEALRMCIRLKMQGNVTELMELFVDALNVLDSKDFVEIVSARIEYLYLTFNAQMELHPIVSMLLDKPKIGIHFLSIMAGYMTDHKLEILADPDLEEYRFLLKLFKLLFHTLMKPEIHTLMAMGETKTILLVSTLVKITQVCLDRIRSCPNCQGYLQLLSFLFQYLNQSRLQFTEMVLLLPPALELFLCMLDGPDLGVSRELLIKLCLLLPLELEKKYPVLPKLMKPLLMALKGTDDMVMLAIQTMEEWIDRLNPDFLEPAMSSVVQEIHLALWSHLKPQKGNPAGPRVLQLLGKLGGRNRRFLADPLQLEWKDKADHELRLMLSFYRDTRFLIPLDKCIALTRQGLLSKSSPVIVGDPQNELYYRRQAMQFLHVCLSAMMNLGHLQGLPLNQENLKAIVLEGIERPQSPPGALGDGSHQIKSQYLKEKQTLTSLIAASITLCLDPDLKEDAIEFAQGICRHFALLFHLSAPPETNSSEFRSFVQIAAGETPPMRTFKYLEPDLFLDAIVEVLGNEQTAVSKGGAQALCWFLEMLLAANKEKTIHPIQPPLLEGGSDGAGAGQPSQCGTSDLQRQRNIAGECGLPDVINDVLHKVLDCCFGDTWSVKAGGIYGIEVLVEELPSLYLMRVFPQLLRGLLHLMHALPSHCLSFRSTLKELLLKLAHKTAHSILPTGESFPGSQELNEVIDKLTATIFLLTASETIREDCHECLAMLCRISMRSITDVLDSFVLQTSKGLRKYLEECQQAAAKLKTHRSMLTAYAPHMEGLARLLVYCIEQELPSVARLFPQILDCANFAITFVCEIADDVTIFRPPTASRMDRVNITPKMRESVLKMLVLLSHWEVLLNQFDRSEAKKTFDAMVQLFFQKLIAPEEKLREIAKTGLSYAVRDNRVTAYDCQNLLKPILSKLSQYSTLDLNVLHGGAEALRMLSGWLHYNLGQKFLEHLKIWLRTDSNIPFQRNWPPVEDTKIASAILELFHLLPERASSFLETQKSGADRIGLVVLTIELEEKLGHASPVGPVPHILWSPYRAPLTKFLIKYKKEAVSYFLAPTRMQNSSYVTRFIDIIKSRIGEPLLLEVMDSSQLLLSLLQPDANGPESSAMDVPMASVHALQLIKTISKIKPEWLPNQRALFLSLAQIWHTINMKDRAAKEEKMTHGELFESKAVAKCLLSYISVHHSEVATLVSLLRVFECSSKVDFRFIKEYCIEYVPSNYSRSELRNVLLYVLEHLNGDMSQGQAIFVLRFLVMPILQSLIRKNEMHFVVTLSFVHTFVDQVKNATVQRDVCLEVELLDAGRLLTVGAPTLCDDTFRHNMLKYAWNFLKAENIECKSHAFLLVAYLIRSLNLSDRAVLQVFVNLLKSDFAETKRELVQEALDVMVPALAERFDQKAEMGGFPVWIEYAVKHMVGEGHKLNLLMNLWQMVIGHPDLFYDFRSQFFGQMVNTLSRLRRPPTNASPENRQMAIDMERVIVNWEVQRIKGSGDGCSEHTVSPPPLSGETFVNMKKMVVAFLAKTVFAVLPDQSKDSTAAKYSYGDILGILRRALDVWPEVEFRLDFVERLIEGSQMQHQPPALILTAALDLVTLALEYQPELFLAHGWHHLIVLAQKVVTMKKEELLEKLCKALERVFGMDQPNASLLDALETHLLVRYLDSRGLSGNQGSIECEISACLRILESDTQNRTGMVLRFLSPLVKLLERHSRDYINFLQTSASLAPLPVPPSDPDAVPLPHFGSQMYNVCKIIGLCGSRLHDLEAGEREVFVISMIHFLYWKGGRAPDRAVFYHILLTVSRWLREFIHNGESPGLRQDRLLWTMQQICKLDANGLVEPHMKKHFDGLFLSTMYEVYTAEGINSEFRNKVFLHVEQIMLSGIRTTTPELRKKFFCLYQDYLGTSLFERLKFILQTQEWDHVASRFWLKQALDYLLAFLNGNEAISFSPHSPLLIPFPTASRDTSRRSSWEDASLDRDVMAVDVDHMGPFDRMLLDHLHFIRKRSSYTTNDLMVPLREYAHVNSVLACHLWVSVFPIVWTALDKNSQISLAKPIIVLLSKPYHAVQAHRRPNVIQGLLEGISLMQPQPKIPPELIKYLGKTYNAWHIAITLLESHVLIFPEESRCFDALAELYSLLSEDNVMFGLLKKRFQNKFTHAGINLMQCGHWEEALHIFGEAAVQFTETRIRAAPREVMLWSEEWCRCAKELNQWDELHSWAEASDSIALLADASWRLPDPDWAELRRLLQSAKQQFPDQLQYSMLMIYSAFQENNTGLCNTHITHAIEQCLQRWWQLPEIGIAGHINLLQKFQRVVEVCESARAFMELAPPRSGQREQSNFMKDILETWRLRSPNVWEPLSVWSDVFIWRHIIYSSIVNSTSVSTEPNSPSLHHLCIKDKAWSINRLANVARKHGALDVCIDIENTMYNDSYMDVQEAFLKIVEQSKAYLLMNDQKLAGLTMLCNTNLEYFPYHGLQAQIFKLQGDYYRALEDPEKANQSFSTAIALNHQFPEAWLSWGAFCDDMYEKKKQDPIGATQLEYAVGCYFQAMQLSSAAARAMIPRCLELLSFDTTATVDKVFREMLNGQESIPSWYWLFYIPQILSVLHRPEGECLKIIPPKIIQSHPQALYYILRVHMLNVREAAYAVEKFRQCRAENPNAPSGSNTADASQTANAASGAPSGGTRDEAALQGAPANLKRNFDAVKGWMDRLKQQLGALANTLEVMLKEIASNFMAKPEERLLAVVHVLLARCCKVAGAQTMRIPDTLIREISGVCRACFPDTRTSTAVHRNLKESFIRHLSPAANNFPETLGALTERLKKWRNMLSDCLDEQMPTTLQLHRESPVLQELCLHGIEMPCQYSKTPDSIADTPVYLDKICSEIRTIRRHGTAFRRIAFYDSDGRKTHFILQHGHTSGQPASSEERMLQLMCLFNRLLNKHHQCRSRFLNFFAPVIVPVWNKVRLVEEDPCFTTFLEAFEVNCQQFNHEADLPVKRFKWRIYSGEDDPEKLAPAAFEEISKIVLENIFSQYMYKTLPSPNHIWVFKQQFCTQMALSAVMSVMLSIGGRVPGKILFSRSSGKVLQVDFCPTVDTTGYVYENEEAVPFRLTRNLTSFFSSFGVEGVFMTSMAASSMAFTQRYSNLSSCLSLFFRDELLAWASRRESRSHLIAHMAQLQPVVERNVAMAMTRIKDLCPVIPNNLMDEAFTLSPVIKAIKDLVERATDPRQLCKMDPTWHPWY